jgi:hypothetical protein
MPVSFSLLTFGGHRTPDRLLALVQQRHNTEHGLQGWGPTPDHREEHSMITVPVVQVTASVIIALFVLQVVRHLAASSDNSAAQGLADGITFLTAP